MQVICVGNQQVNGACIPFNVFLVFKDREREQECHEKHFPKKHKRLIIDNNWMKKTRIYAAVLILTFIISLRVYLMQDSAATEKKFISKVIDGDTVVAEGDSIRLIGIDTDERGQPCYSDAKKR